MALKILQALPLPDKEFLAPKSCVKLKYGAFPSYSVRVYLALAPLGTEKPPVKGIFPAILDPGAAWGFAASQWQLSQISLPPQHQRMPPLEKVRVDGQPLVERWQMDLWLFRNKPGEFAVVGEPIRLSIPSGVWVVQDYDWNGTSFPRGPEPVPSVPRLGMALLHANKLVLTLDPSGKKVDLVKQR